MRRVLTCDGFVHGAVLTYSPRLCCAWLEFSSLPLFCGSICNPAIPPCMCSTGVTVSSASCESGAGSTRFLLNGVSWNIPDTWHWASCISSSKRLMTCTAISEESVHYVAVYWLATSFHLNNCEVRKGREGAKGETSVGVRLQGGVHTSIIDGRLDGRDLTHSSASSTNILWDQKKQAWFIPGRASHQDLSKASRNTHQCLKTPIEHALQKPFSLATPEREALNINTTPEAITAKYLK